MFYTPQRLSERLAALGWQADLTATPTYFLFGQATASGASGASGATAPR
ncbi:MAG: hypothetical protein ACRDID_17180 [Ktedonobacterales bacterium]